MHAQKTYKARGIFMLLSFFILLIVIFSPVFPEGQNGLDYMDALFNKISKGSVNFIPDAIQKSDAYNAQMLSVSFSAKSASQAEEIYDLFRKNDIEAAIDGTQISIHGNMAAILKGSLHDTELMFNNTGAPVAEKYGKGEKEVLYYWWKAFEGISGSLNAQKKFKEAKVFDSIKKKTIEPAYNYYGIDSGNYKDYLGIIIAALAFYVFYTLWYGFGIMYLFEGLGLNIGH